MEKKAYLSIHEMFRFLKCESGSRCFIEGEEVVNAGHVILCGLRHIDECQANIYALCLKTSSLTNSPHEINGKFELKNINEENMYKIIVNTFNCTCKAGASGHCKHVSAVLLHCTRENVMSFEKLSSTDLKCVWSERKEMTVKNYKPMPLVETDCVKVPVPNNFLGISESDILQKFISSLPNSALAKHSVGRRIIVDDCKSYNNTNENIGIEEKINITILINHSVQSTLMLELSSYFINLKENSKVTYKSFYYNYCNIEDVCFETMINKSIWDKERKFRVTGSRCYPLYTYKGTDWNKKSSNYFNFKQITNDSIRHGQNEEDNARNAYKLKTNTCVQETGIIISNSNPWLSYSPDGIVTFNNVPQKLLEIKCPYIGKDYSINEVVKNCKFIEIKNGIVNLKHKHQYYGQIQLGMALLNVESCDFVIYASNDQSLQIITVPFDYSFSLNMLKKIKENLFNYMLHTQCKN